MTFWLLAAFLLLFTLFAIVWPLLSQGARRADATDVQIYKDQLREIDRDIERGVVERADGEASRAEISRRLLKAAQNQRASQSSSRRVARVAAVTLLFAVPAASLAAYLQIGSPRVPDMPLEARKGGNGDNQDNGQLETLVARVETHLSKKPDDGEGWLVIAPVYLRLGRVADSVAAYEKALQFTPPTADLWSAYGEAAVMLASGRITERARAAFEEARKLQPGGIKPRFYLALYLSQGERFADAERAWRELLDGAPQGAPWTQIAEAHLNQARAGLAASGMVLSGDVSSETEGPEKLAASDPLPGPGKADIEAAAEMSQGDRQAFINSMVANLKARLESEGGKVEEWVRLMRASTVLGKADDAQAAYRQASAAFAEDEKAQALLDNAAQSLGIPFD